MHGKFEKLFHATGKLWLAIMQTLAIVEADMRKVRHDPYEVCMRMVQPAMWLVLFGQAMSHMQTLEHFGNLNYLDFIAPGVLAQSVLFVAIFYGIALIWERDTGILYKIMVTPAPREALVVGRALGAGVRSLFQLVMIYVLSWLLSIDLRLDIAGLVGVMGMVMLIAAIFSTISLIAASIVKKRERFMGIGQLLTMPFFFASNALYPIESMPHWIRAFSIVNPLTYQVDALRALMIRGQTSQFGLAFDFIISIAIFLVLVRFATRRYPKLTA